MRWVPQSPLFILLACTCHCFMVPLPHHRSVSCTTATTLCRWSVSSLEHGSVYACFGSPPFSHAH